MNNDMNINDNGGNGGGSTSSLPVITLPYEFTPNPKAVQYTAIDIIKPEVKYIDIELSDDGIYDQIYSDVDEIFIPRNINGQEPASNRPLPRPLPLPPSPPPSPSLPSSAYVTTINPIRNNDTGSIYEEIGSYKSPRHTFKNMFKRKSQG